MHKISENLIFLNNECRHLDSEKRCATSMAGSQICRGFKVHDLITCNWKVQGHGVVALGRH